MSLTLAERLWRSNDETNKKFSFVCVECGEHVQTELLSNDFPDRDSIKTLCYIPYASTCAVRIVWKGRTCVTACIFLFWNIYSSVWNRLTDKQTATLRVNANWKDQRQRNDWLRIKRHWAWFERHLNTKKRTVDPTIYDRSPKEISFFPRTGGMQTKKT